METPSEWAKRFNSQKTDDKAGSPNPEAASIDNAASDAEFPSDPFACPACGQLLAPSCRVCVACKHIINPAEIARPREVIAPVVSARAKEPRAVPVRYPWRIFFAVLGVSFLLALILESFWGEETAKLAMGGVQTLAGIWVFFDAVRQRVPRALRWAVGTMLLPVVVFPWYLARRSKPQSPVPFVEAEVGPVTRLVLFAILVIFLASLIFSIVQRPRPTTAPTPRPQMQKPGGDAPSRITYLRPWRDGGRRIWRDEGLRWMSGASSAQAEETSAPSDA